MHTDTCRYMQIHTVIYTYIHIHTQHTLGNQCREWVFRCCCGSTQILCAALHTQVISVTVSVSVSVSALSLSLSLCLCLSLSLPISLSLTHTLCHARTTKFACTCLWVILHCHLQARRYETAMFGVPGSGTRGQSNLEWYWKTPDSPPNVRLIFLSN